MAVRIVVDVMGADRPPEELAAGALAAAERLPIQLILVGRRRLIEPHIPPEAPAEIVDCEGFVAPEAPPVQAIRQRGTSVVRGLEMVKGGEADGFLSSGNTGAVVAASLAVLGRLAGVKRPGLCASLPTLAGKQALVIDAGATAEPKPPHLAQFAHMGRLFAQEVLGIPEPTIGLLSIGSEALKGDKLVRAAHKLLEKEPGFAGNVEPHELLIHRPVDVVVTGGFAGNLVIKALEGGAEAVWEAFKRRSSASLQGRLGAGLLRGSLREVARQLRYDRYNGAPLLGVQGLVMLAHGRSTARAMEAAVERTFWATQAGLVARIREGLSQGAES
ncbi:MAG: phosphate acyltransferase PlsX [Candidatus Bipolaricaulaceae bacterium]